MLFRLAELRYQQSIQLQKSGNNRGNQYSMKQYTMPSSHSSMEEEEEKEGTAMNAAVDGLTAFQSNPFALLRDGLATFSMDNQQGRLVEKGEVCQEREQDSFQYLRYLKYSE